MNSLNSLKIQAYRNSLKVRNAIRMIEIEYLIFFKSKN